MLKYTNALIWRAKTQIETTIHIVDVITLFSGVLVPLFMLIFNGGVWVRNLILLVCGVGLATFALVQEITKKKASKDETESIKFWVKIVRILADAYALFLLCYGVFSASKDPSFITVLPVIPVGLSLLWNLLMLAAKIVVNKVFELVWDAIELDTKPVYETVKKTQQLWHLIKNDGIEIETRIEVSEHNKNTLDRTLVKFKAAMAAKKTEQQLGRQQQQVARATAVKTFLGRLPSFVKGKKGDASVGAAQPQQPAELPVAIEEPTAQIEAPKRKNPLGFLAGKKKKVTEQLPEASDEKTPEEALPKT